MGGDATPFQFYDYQLEDVNKLQSQSSVLIASEMGIPRHRQNS